MAKRKPKKKSKLQKKKESQSSKYWKQKADDAWKAEIHKVGQCEVCGRSDHQLHAHHLISRTNLRYRHDLSNGILLCSVHHTLGGYMEDICAEGDMRQVDNFKSWMEENRPGQYQWWQEHKEDKRKPEKTYQAIYEELNAGGEG